MNRFFTRLAQHRLPVVVAALVIVSVSAVLAVGVRVDYSVEQFFPTWGRERAVFDRYRAVFPGEDAQVAFFLSTPSGLDGAAYAVLGRVADAFDERGLVDVQWPGSVPVIARAAATGHGLGKAATLVRRHPLYDGFLWNADGTVSVVQGRLPPALNHDAARRALVDALSSTIDSLGVTERWALSGTPVIRAKVPELLEVDQTVLLGGGILLFFVILFAYFRHAGIVFIGLGAVAPAYVVTLALMALTGRPVTILTSFIPIVILVVGICDTTHLLEHWSQTRSAGRGRIESVAETFERLAVSCFFTSITTAIGFASLAATGIAVVADFGIFTAFAVMATYAFTITVLPPLLTFVAAPPSVGRHGRRWGPVAALVRLARAALARRSRWVLPAFGVVTIAGLALASRLPIDTYLVDDLKDGTSIKQDLRWVQNAGFGLFQTNLFVRADAGELLRPEMVDWMDRFQRFVEKDPLVIHTFGLADVRRATQAPLQDVADAIPEWIYRPDHRAAQVVVTVRDAGSRVTLPFLDRVDDYLRRNPPPAGTADLTGTVRMADTFSFHVLRSFGPSIVLALLLIWLVMAVLFRSLRMGLVAMVPNLFPLVTLAGVMALLGVSLKPSTILVFSIAFGIAVDDSIHLMSRFNQLVARGRMKGRALRGALRETGSALVMSTVVVTAGFSLLMLSRFEILFLLGLLTATTALAALAADLLMFPALIDLAGSWARKDGDGPGEASGGAVPDEA